MTDIQTKRREQCQLGKPAIIAGASRGIGRAIAIRLASDGANLKVANLGASVISSMGRLLQGFSLTPTAVTPKASKLIGA
jgi:NAD(P)-dependent dehydrogenase (short-subunit alcohol dehydrogenase family)